MAFWSSWFAPPCVDCGEKIVDHEPIDVDGGKLCPPCQGKRAEAKAKHDAEVEERRQAEEAARAKFEDRKSFGSDPRTDQ